MKEVGGGSDYLKEVSIGSDYLKERGSGSSLLKENNTCQCVPGGTSRGYRNRKLLGHVCAFRFLKFIYISDSGITV